MCMSFRGANIEHLSIAAKENAIFFKKTFKVVFRERPKPSEFFFTKRHSACCAKSCNVFSSSAQNRSFRGSERHVSQLCTLTFPTIHVNFANLTRLIRHYNRGRQASKHAFFAHFSGRNSFLDILTYWVRNRWLCTEECHRFVRHPFCPQTRPWFAPIFAKLLYKRSVLQEFAKRTLSFKSKWYKDSPRMWQHKLRFWA